MDKLLIVRLSSLGDIIHAMPVAAALREASPTAQIDWLAEARYRELLESVSVLNHIWTVDLSSLRSIRNAMKTIQHLREVHYECAIDVQGLLKSAILARMSGARRTVGFATDHLREKAAGVLYTHSCAPVSSTHRIQKNLSLLQELGINTQAMQFPMKHISSSMVSTIRSQLGIGEREPFALLIPGAGWPNKQWPAERLGMVARYLHERHSLSSIIDRGIGDDTIAFKAAEVSHGAASVAQSMSLLDLVAVTRAARLVVSGDTGPLHIAAALGTPIVGIYGPTDPKQNGPWSPDDQIVSRYHECQCLYQRRCHSTSPCIAKIETTEVIQAVDRRLAYIAEDKRIAGNTTQASPF
jgi:lipopolysaccharide heptosyltransferase I